MNPILAPRSSVTPIAARVDPRSNGITGLRFFLALSVLVLHAWPIMGLQDPVNAAAGGRLPGGGTLAVLAFFGLSGFLLMDSRRRVSTPVFLWHRALRILPGYWVCVGLVSLIVGWSYAAGAVLPWPGVGGAAWSGFASLPLDNVNASLWTLAPEITCYLVLAVCPVRFLRYAVPLGIAYLVLGHAAEPYLGRLTFGLITWDVAFAFALGAALNLARDWLPLHGGFAAIALLLGYASLGSDAQVYAVAFAVTYAALWAAVRLPVRWRTDLSYGVYIYAFPIMQFAMLAGLGRYGPVGLALITTALTIPVAMFSWHYVERPALGAKRWRPSLSLWRTTSTERVVRALNAPLVHVEPESR
jgi:peptidoglycan/LPS O-acetylase OafA/YrhL